MKYKILLFDADGTLLDFKRSEREALSDMLKDFGQPCGDAAARRYSEINDSLWKKLERGEITRNDLILKRFELFAGEYGIKCDPEEMSRAYFSALATKSFLIAGALDVCRELSKTCRLFLITNGFKHIQESRFGGSLLAQFFEGVFISEEIGADKPSREYFDAVIAAIPDFDARETLVIGDSLSSDIAGGIGAGLDVCWYNPAGAAAPGGMKINYIIADLSELTGIVNGK
ncbi:MAG: YjjG family noncanonical pyrimidine nucleotidase [Eubacteriales bacterium]